MPNRLRVLFAALFAAALLPGAGAGFYQSTTRAQTPGQGTVQPAASASTISGVVVDKDGGIVPGATVVLTKVATGEKLPPQVTNASGAYSFSGLAPGKYKVTITLQGFKTQQIDVTVTAGANIALNTKLEVGQVTEAIYVTAGQTPPRSDRNAPTPPPAQAMDSFYSTKTSTLNAIEEISLRTANVRGETYAQFVPNQFNSTIDHPLSTFGADVDTASFSNIRRFLSNGQLPPAAAVRLEELVNYFHFPYATPRDGQPIALTTEIGDCPWAPTHKLALIGAKAAAPAPREVTGRNIVLLIDVSGSMQPQERLPLLKTAFGLFVDTLRPTDTVAIVTYAGTSGIALPATSVRRREVIQDAIASLSAGGSTNGGQGLILAYQIARQSFIQGGVNRVILATDGDFNVGVTSQSELLQLIERERQSGVFLSVLGVGSGNLKDATMEMLADRGNGHYAYLDSLQEARRVLVREGEATLETVAKDVKFQVEFNPAVVAKWKLLGYETRALAARDFNDDRKDAGEMGAGHTVTVLYEIVPAGVEGTIEPTYGRPEVDPLKYQPETNTPRPSPRPVPADASGEWFTVKARYKLPEGETSSLITRPARYTGPTQNLSLASAIVEFGLILRDDPRDGERWDALTSRVDRVAVPAGLATDVAAFKELLATARGLARIR